MVPRHIATFLNLKPNGLDLKLSNTDSQVPCITLDEYLTDHGMSHVDIVRIANNGFALWSLAGAAEALESGHISLLDVEYSSTGTSWQNASVKNLVDVMFAYGYESYMVTCRPLPHTTCQPFKLVRTDCCFLTLNLEA